MKNKAPVWVVVGLVAGLTLGSIGVASAAPVADPATGEPMGFGLRMGTAIRDAGARMVDILADLTGLDLEEVTDRRAAGESVADIAESEGVDVADVVGEATSVREQMLDERVADGTITAEDKDAILEQMNTRMNERVQSTDAGTCGEGGRGGGRGGMGGGGRGAGGMGGAGCGAPVVDSSAAAPVTF